MKLLLPFVFLFTSTQVFCQLHQADSVLLLMGSRYEITAVHEDKSIAEQSIKAAIQEIERIEQLISSWNPSSQTSEINRNAGLKTVKVDKELYQLIERSLKVSKLTNGYFNIAFGPLSELWKEYSYENQLPPADKIKAALQLIDVSLIQIDQENQSIFLKEKGMKIGFGAIGKGYSANQAKKIMQELGIQNGMVNAGGDLTVWGKAKNDKAWKIGIADPDKKSGYIAWLELSNTSIVTSGNYEKYVTINGKKYTHIINPKSGMPVEGVKSVTILSPDAELSDALATSVFVMGVEKGLELIDRLKNTECLIIDDKNHYWQSKGLNLNFY